MESFRSIVDSKDANNIMSQLMKAALDKQTEIQPSIAEDRTEREKFKVKLISQLVAKLVNIFSTPDTIYIRQEDHPEVNINREKGEEGEEVAKTEPYMYFIRNGRYTVHVKDQFLAKQSLHQETSGKEDERDKELVSELFDGDHFGEIGLIYGAKRTATVRSENYGTLALLSKTAYVEMLKSFENMANLFKLYTLKYHDPILNFIGFELDKIHYFRHLAMNTKQELIYSMERITFEQGSFMCQKDQIADKLYLIQDGVVEIAVKYDTRLDDGRFVIERLTKGAIINHRSFLLKDDADTDFKCVTAVSCYALDYQKMKVIKSKRADL